MDEHCWQSGLADGEDIVLLVTTVSLVSKSDATSWQRPSHGVVANYLGLHGLSAGFSSCSARWCESRPRGVLDYSTTPWITDGREYSL